MIFVFFLIFIVLPIAEIAVFIVAGRTIGVLPTIAITLATAFLGSFLLRRQGFAAIRRFTECAERNELPIEPVLDSVGILFAAVLLMTPGFVTDAMGVLLFIPLIRRAFGRAVFRQLLAGEHIRFQYHGPSAASSRPRPKDPVKGPRDNVVDAEFEIVDPRDKREKPTPVEPADDEAKSGDRQSPWRRK